LIRTTASSSLNYDGNGNLTGNGAWSRAYNLDNQLTGACGRPFWPARPPNWPMTASISPLVGYDGTGAAQGRQAGVATPF
jgi:hypothetical protein